MLLQHGAGGCPEQLTGSAIPELTGPAVRLSENRKAFTMYLWIIAAAAAYFIKGLCGFANTLVFTSILSFGASNANISPIDLLLGYPTNLILTWKNRKSLDPKVYLPLAALVLAGSIPGALLLKNVAPEPSSWYSASWWYCLARRCFRGSTAKSAFVPPGRYWR